MDNDQPNPALWEDQSEIHASGENSGVGESPAIGENSPSGEGGEWEVLATKLSDWAGSDGPQSLWQQLQAPLKAFGWLLGFLVLLRIYGALLGALASFPLLPGLLELTGLVWLCSYAAPKLLRRSDRETLIADLKRSWQGLGEGR